MSGMFVGGHSGRSGVVNRLFGIGVIDYVYTFERVCVFAVRFMQNLC